MQEQYHIQDNMNTEDLKWGDFFSNIWEAIKEFWSISVLYKIYFLTQASTLLDHKLLDVRAYVLFIFAYVALSSIPGTCVYLIIR